MRLELARLAAVVIIAFSLFAPRAAAQNPDTMMPEQSAAKARQILQQLIDSLGGPSYLSIRESECTGRLAQFARTGELSGYDGFRDYWKYPDYNRTDYTIKTGRVLQFFLGGLVPDKKNRVIQLYAKDKGWTLDRNGVNEMAAPQIADFQEQVKRDIDNLLRLRLKEEGMTFRYGGSGIVDLKEVEWVEIVDRDERTFRLAIDRDSHLLVRSVVSTRDETTRERSEEVTLYSNFKPQDGVQTPLQVARERDGRRIFQAFYNMCKYNPGFSDDLFTKAFLEKLGSEAGVKKNKN